MEKGLYRIVVCIDVEAEAPADAYGKVYQQMNASASDWESSDEWFFPDGREVPIDEVNTARMAFFDKNEV